MGFPEPEKYTLQCEWGQCHEIFELMDDFYIHLDQHFWTDVAMVPVEAGSTLPCQWRECNFSTTNSHDLIRHVYFHGFHTKLKWLGYLKHKKSKTIQCQTRQNRNIIPELPDGFKCCWESCYIIADIPDKYYDHVRDHATIADPETLPSGKKGFKCHWDGCTYEYVTEKKAVYIGRHKLRGHMATHTQERCYACPWCGNLYVNRTKLIDHFTRQIDAENHNFQCTHCSRTFASERLLKDHMRHHVNHYKCPKCAMTCPNPSALKHHIRYKHSTERPYSCEFCDYKSKEPYDMLKHMELHQSDLTYHCQVAGCNYEVRSIQNLRNHYRVKHGSGDGKYYACHLCEKKYGTGFQLTYHLRKIHSFQWPPGHCRFRYKECEDGMYRLQIFRYESIELTKQITVADVDAIVEDSRNSQNNTSASFPTQSTSSTNADKFAMPSRTNSKRKKKANRERKNVAIRKVSARAKKNNGTKSTKSSRRSSNKSPAVTSQPVQEAPVQNLEEKTELANLSDLFFDSNCLENTPENSEYSAARTSSLVASPSKEKRTALQAWLSSGNTYDVDVGIIDSEYPHDHNWLATHPQEVTQSGDVEVDARGDRPSKSTPSELNFTKTKEKLGSALLPNKRILINAGTNYKDWIKESTVNIVPLENLTFPSHHKICCSRSDKDCSCRQHDPSSRAIVENGSDGDASKSMLSRNKFQTLSDLGSPLENVQDNPSTPVLEFCMEPETCDKSLCKNSHSTTLGKYFCESEVGNYVDYTSYESSSDDSDVDMEVARDHSAQEFQLDKVEDRTLVNIGGEEFVLVSGKESSSGNSIYCLFKASEIPDALTQEQSSAC